MATARAERRAKEVGIRKAWAIAADHGSIPYRIALIAIIAHVAGYDTGGTVVALVQRFG